MRDNGLTASKYTSMGGIDPRIAEPVLKALAEAGIAAYAGKPDDATTEPSEASTGRTAEPTGQTPTARAAEPTGQTPTARTAEPTGETPTARTAEPTGETPIARVTESADGVAEAAGAPSSSPQPSGAEGDAKADAATASEPVLSDRKPATRIPAGLDEIFVDAESEVRARGVIARSTEDAEWASLVEQFGKPSAEGHDATPVPRWPVSEDVDESSYEPLIDVPAGLIVGDTDEEPPEEPPARRREDHHDHYVPPEPPRGPKLDWISRAAWLGVIGGPLLLMAAALLDFGTGRITTIAVIGFIGGFLTLVVRMGDRLPPEDTTDDGAVV
ncbi:hypothetical protein [Kribbella sp. CA-293567]|uniref:hypothetical protein n=1 Tax=Kribbella sp. CA-293567 TaxID=3002436 RepID=UPI0022DE2151|nr:hypothetical protein [Kribbella sp. CA-293567]WBQ02650.1 hypothetical protein OX958_21995 [Kribbella sp. CA-293567]